MKKDIEHIDDIKLLVDSFYKKVIVVETIGYFFTKVIQFDWQVHLPVMYSFWDTILFGTMSYKGNPMVKHIEMNKKESLKKEHFDQWMKLWKETIDELFIGEKANEAKKRAGSIAQLMQYKIQNTIV
ncbi:group III truncated hemoglobin [Ferruginibacter sp. SUN002]|uniref:group III truncated hemoglobin n=1 Tax=Ferruginibacter sp. SUN002 TaxID=2937789 RepID=UPI003D363B26